MSNLSWMETFRDTLQKWSRPIRLAVLGIGHELCGDDAAGLYMVRSVSKLLGARENLLMIEAGPAPENFVGTLRRFHPDLVLLIDAAQMDAIPGTIRWLDWRATYGLSASSHTLPLHLLGAYLTHELACFVALLGIQPAMSVTCTRMTPGIIRIIESSAREMANCLIQWL